MLFYTNNLYFLNIKFYNNFNGFFFIIFGKSTQPYMENQSKNRNVQIFTKNIFKTMSVKFTSSA